MIGKINVWKGLSKTNYIRLDETHPNFYKRYLCVHRKSGKIIICTSNKQKTVKP
jgi:O-glycosyl hydrolase